VGVFRFAVSMVYTVVVSALCNVLYDIIMRE